jgi:hypothetical protein
MCRTGDFHPRRVLRYAQPNPRQPVGAGFERRIWSPRGSTRRNHDWQEVPHSSRTHARAGDRPGEHRAGRACADAHGLGDRVADAVFDPDVNSDADRRITHGDSDSDIDSHGDADPDRNATHADSHGDADTDGDTHGNADTHRISVTDASYRARSFSLLQGRDDKGLAPVHTQE